MAERLDWLFQEWHRIGGAVILAEADPNISARNPEELIAESTAHCWASGRLTWVVLDWLIRNVEEIDEQRLLRETLEGGDQSVLGVLSDAAYQRKPHAKFAWLVHACTPNPRLEIFFHRVARSPLATRLARENALDLFRRWNYFSNELCYLGDPASKASVA